MLENDSTCGTSSDVAEEAGRFYSYPNLKYLFSYL